MTQSQMPTKAELAADARALVRRALKASLATIAAGSGHPYASLITVATEAFSARLTKALASAANSAFVGICGCVIFTCATRIIAALHY